jgi:hypothetical protein
LFALLTVLASPGLAEGDKYITFQVTKVLIARPHGETVWVRVGSIIWDRYELKIAELPDRGTIGSVNDGERALPVSPEDSKRAQKLFEEILALTESLQEKVEKREHNSTR